APVAAPAPVVVPAPEPVPAPLPVVEPPAVLDCRINGRSDHSSRPCQPPRWGHTETGNPRPT
ncbi:MAG: hypothetical protein ACRD0S_08315, partial [Acidimicrobiales bacterium]